MKHSAQTMLSLLETTSPKWHTQLLYPYILQSSKALKWQKSFILSLILVKCRVFSHDTALTGLLHMTLPCYLFYIVCKKNNSVLCERTNATKKINAQTLKGNEYIIPNRQKAVQNLAWLMSTIAQLQPWWRYHSCKYSIGNTGFPLRSFPSCSSSSTASTALFMHPLSLCSCCSIFLYKSLESSFILRQMSDVFFQLSLHRCNTSETNCWSGCILKTSVVYKCGLQVSGTTCVPLFCPLFPVTPWIRPKVRCYIIP